MLQPAFWCVLACVSCLRPGPTDRMSESLFNAPSAMEAHLQDLVWNPEAFTPFGHRERLSTLFDEAVPSGVPVLLDACSPSTVGWRVVSVVVETIDGMVPGRSRSHVGQEGSKIDAPSITDADATSAVVLVADVGVALTAANHVRPAPVLSRPKTAMRLHGTRVTTLGGEV